jgi:nucleoside-diphosphate-sugar epimerase
MPVWLATRLLGTVGALQRKLGQASELSAAMMLLLNRPGGYSIEKARSMLGYEPLVSFDEGMRRTEEWARAEGLI